MKFERMINNIPEERLLKLYAGIHLDKFTSIWHPVHSPKSGSFEQIRLKTQKTDEYLHMSYSKTVQCILLTVKIKKNDLYYTINRTRIAIEDPNGIEKARKTIEKFLFTKD
jgi:hypothetical protein